VKLERDSIIERDIKIIPKIFFLNIYIVRIENLKILLIHDKLYKCLVFVLKMVSRGVKIFIFSILFVLIIAGIGVYILFFGISESYNLEDVSEVAINYNNFIEQMSRQSLVRDLPSDGEIVLKFYNYNSGEKEYEKSFILKSDSVEEGDSENADILIEMHSRYIEVLTNKNFCSVVPQAKKNGDMSTDTKLSASKLSWKYKGMLKYKNCLGF